MRKLIFAAALAAASLAGCATIPGAPADVANQTVLDERAAIGAELAYQAAGTALSIATEAGLVTGDRALVGLRAEERAFAALRAVRAAYDAGNAVAYDAALIEARAAVTAVLLTINGSAPR